MPVVSERQRKFFGAEISRKKAGEPGKTSMSIDQLREFLKAEGKRSLSEALKKRKKKRR